MTNTMDVALKFLKIVLIETEYCSMKEYCSVNVIKVILFKQFLRPFLNLKKAI